MVVYIPVCKNGTNFVRQTRSRDKQLAANTRFGFKLDFDGNTLAITSRGGDLEKVTTFRPKQTQFDNASTEFKLIDNDSGLVSIYETINDTLLYAQDFAYNTDTQDFGNIMRVNDNHIYLGLPKQQVNLTNEIDRGLVAEYRKPKGMTNWTIARSPVDPVDTSKLKGVYLFDKTDNSLVTYLDYIDPL